MSRCQRYDYGRLSTETIEGRLREVSDAEELRVEDKALRYIAGAADGSMRDGLSLLDQCNAFNYGNEILTYEKTLEILGAVDTRVFSKLYNHIHEGDTAEALKVLEDVLMQGREMMQFVADFLWYLRNLMLLCASESTKDSLDISADNLAQMIEDARKSELSEIMREIRIFSSLVEQIRYSASRRILTEMAIIRAARGRMGGADTGAEDQLDTLRNRIRELEQRLLDDEKKIAERPSGNGWGAAGSGPGQAADTGKQETAVGGQPAQAKSAAKKQYPKVLSDEFKDRNYLPITAMFVPYEAPLMEALRADPSIWQFAAQNNVILITPLTLLAYIRLVYLAWQHEKEARNQQEIVDTARELLARMNSFLITFENLGHAIGSLQDEYEKARTSLVDAPRTHTIAKAAKRLIDLHVRLENSRGKKLEQAECLKEPIDAADDEEGEHEAD